MREGILEFVNIRSYEVGEVIFDEGDESTEAYHILTGWVEILICTPRGLEPIAQLQPGDIFGEMGIIDDKPRSATARAYRALSVEVIDEKDFEKLVLRHPVRLRDYLKTLFERLRTTDQMLELALRRGMDATGHEGTLLSGVAGEEVAPSLEGALHTVGMGSVRGEQPPGIEEEMAASGEESTLVLCSDTIGNRTVDRFPFRIGRELAGGLEAFDCNDLGIPDKQPYQVSRNHCAIERYHRGYVIRDRGSSGGTIVNGKPLNVVQGEVTGWLHPGENDVILGSPESPHRLKLIVS